LNLNATFALAPANIFINAPSNMIVPGNKYLLGILNSKLADFYIRNLGVTRNGGYFEYKPMFIEKLPIIEPTKEQNSSVEEIVTKLSDIRNKSQSSFEEELDHYIFKMYDLTHNEIKYLRNTPSKST
jgi:hypothetical protein